MLTHTPQCLARDYNVPGSCQTSDEECYHQIVAWSPMVRLPPQPKWLREDGGCSQKY